MGLDLAVGGSLEYHRRYKHQSPDVATDPHGAAEGAPGGENPGPRVFLSGDKR